MQAASLQASPALRTVGGAGGQMHAFSDVAQLLQTACSPPFGSCTNLQSNARQQLVSVHGGGSLLLLPLTAAALRKTSSTAFKWGLQSGTTPTMAPCAAT
ncbi:hypothetical protein ABPG75_010016, partial [Micractinium tetrahymenae]